MMNFVGCMLIALQFTLIVAIKTDKVDKVHGDDLPGNLPVGSSDEVTPGNSILTDIKLIIAALASKKDSIPEDIGAQFDTLFTNYCKNQGPNEFCKEDSIETKDRCIYKINLKPLSVTLSVKIVLFSTSAMIQCGNFTTSIPTPVLADYFNQTKLEYEAVGVIRVFVVRPIDLIDGIWDSDLLNRTTNAVNTHNSTWRPSFIDKFSKFSNFSSEGPENGSISTSQHMFTGNYSEITTVTTMAMHDNSTSNSSAITENTNAGLNFTTSVTAEFGANFTTLLVNTSETSSHSPQTTNSHTFSVETTTFFDIDDASKLETIVLVISSILDETEVKSRLENEFADLFTAYCKNIDVAANCEGHVIDLPLDLGGRIGRRQRVRRQVVIGCDYNMIYLNDSSPTTILDKVFNLIVLSNCGGQVLQLPAVLSSNFFNYSADMFSGMQIVAAYPVATSNLTETSTTLTPTTNYTLEVDNGENATDVTVTSSTESSTMSSNSTAATDTNLVQTSIVYVTTQVYDNGLLIATISLSVVLAVILIGLFIYLGHWCLVGRFEREAMVELLRSVAMRKNKYGAMDSQNSPTGSRKASNASSTNGRMTTEINENF